MNDSTIDDLVERAVSVIESGGVAILPADTVYGLMGSVFSREAVERVYRLKGRPRHKPFGVLSQRDRLHEVARVSPTAETVVRSLWPEPVSVIVRKSDRIPGWFTSDNPLLLVLTAANRILSRVLRRSSSPIFSTTCNVSGAREATSVEDLEAWAGKVDLVGAVEGFEFISTTSTIVNCVETPPIVIREGAVSIERIRSFLPELQVDTSHLIQ